MEGSLAFFCFLCLAACAIYAVREIHRIHRERLLMTKMRGSAFYSQLYPMVKNARSHMLDQVRIERSRITFTTVSPPGKLSEFIVPDNGLRILSGERTRILTEILGEDIPVLNTKMYFLRRYRVIRPNGKKDYGYVYTLRRVYKAEYSYAKKAVFNR